MTAPFCRDCKFKRINGLTRLFLGDAYATCMHPTSVRSADQGDYLASGRVRRGGQFYCAVMRISGRGTVCGPDGKFFEPRP